MRDGNNILYAGRGLERFQAAAIAAAAHGSHNHPLRAARDVGLEPALFHPLDYMLNISFGRGSPILMTIVVLLFEKAKAATHLGVAACGIYDVYLCYLRIKLTPSATPLLLRK